MNAKILLKVMGVVLLSMTMIYGSCNKDDDPEPTPTPYSPTFDLTYYTQPIGGIDYLDFVLVCLSDDWEMIKVKITAPGGAGDETYTGNGQLQLRGEPFTFPEYFLKLGGTWTFTITGNIKSGDHNGESFTVTKSASISGK